MILSVVRGASKKTLTETIKPLTETIKPLTETAYGNEQPLAETN